VRLHPVRLLPALVGVTPLSLGSIRALASRLGSAPLLAVGAVTSDGQVTTAPRLVVVR